MVVLLCEETCSTGICEINFTVARAARKRLRNCDARTVSLIAVDNVRLTYTQEFMLSVTAERDFDYLTALESRYCRTFSS